MKKIFILFFVALVVSCGDNDSVLKRAEKIN